MRWITFGIIAVFAAGCEVSESGAAGDIIGRLSAGIPWHHAHPILVNFTAGLVPVSFTSDLIGRLANKESLNSAALWMLAYAALLTPATALTGWLWNQTIPSEALPQDLIEVHKYLGTLLAGVFAGLVIWRGALFLRNRRPGLAYFVALGIAVVLLAYQGNLGGRMVFG